MNSNQSARKRWKPFPEFRRTSGLAHSLAAGLTILAYACSGGAIESISEPDTIIVGQAFNHETNPPHLITEGIVEWKIQSIDAPGEVFTYRARIEELPDGSHYFRFTISHQAALSTFRVDENAVPLGFSEEEYTHLDITVNGEPAMIEGGADTLTLSQENRGSLQELNLNLTFESIDSDGDGIPDWWEQLHHDPNDPNSPDPNFPDADKNTDGDNLTNGDEFWLGTDPNVKDGEFERHGTMEAGKMDLHRFMLDGPSVVTIYTTGSVDTVGTLLDEAMKPLNDPAEDDNARGDALNFEIEKGLTAGTYFVKVTSNFGQNQSGNYSLLIEPVDGVIRPDLRTGVRALPLTHKGNDVYSAGAGQILKVRRKIGRAAVVYLSIENDGDVPDTIRARVPRLSPRHFRVSYREVGAGGITAGLHLGTYLTTLEPGRLKILAGKIKSKGRRKNATFRVSIGSETAPDKVDLNLVRIRFRQ